MPTLSPYSLPIDNAALDAVISRYTVGKPVYDFIAPGDGFGHTFWIIDKQEDIDAITQEFAKMPALYIADGHHRSAAAALVGAEKAKQTPITVVTKSTTISWLCASLPTS